VEIGDGVRVSGRIDLVRRKDTDEVTIVDLKSREQKANEGLHEAQLLLYARGYRDLVGREADFIEAYHLDERKKHRKPLERAAAAKLEQAVRQAAAHVREGSCPLGPRLAVARAICVGSVEALSAKSGDKGGTMDLAAFDRELRALCGSDQQLRPFVCRGSPLACTIAIIGANPATKVPFWPWWNAVEGFQKDAWYAAYLAARSGGVSSTRQRIERVVAGATPELCLETNVYATPSQNLGQLQARDRVRRVTDFLLRSIRPKVVFAHGKEAREELSAAWGQPLHLGEQRVTAPGIGTVHVLCDRHLSRGWSYDAAEAVGRELARLARA